MVTTTADPSKDFPLKISALYNKDLVTVIKRMLDFDRSKRPTLEQILSEPFLQSHKTKLELELKQAKQTKVRENLIGKPMELFKIEFEEKGKLGQGAFGEVTKVIRKRDGVVCAAKKQTANANFEMAKKELLTM